MAELIYLFDKGAQTLQTLLLKMGRVDQYHRTVAQFDRTLTDAVQLKESTVQLYKYIEKLIKLIDKLNHVFDEYHRCKVQMTKMMEIALEQELYKFKEVGKYQDQMDELCLFGAKVCRHATKLLSEHTWPRDITQGDK